jgi:Flp pilus assembly pilin Flp
MKIFHKLMDLHRDEVGLEMTEYAIMAALIIVVGAAAIVTMGSSINSVFTHVTLCLSTTGCP